MLLDGSHWPGLTICLTVLCTSHSLSHATSSPHILIHTHTEAAIEAARAEAREANRLAEERGAQAVAAFTEAKEMAAELRVKTEQVGPCCSSSYVNLQTVLAHLISEGHWPLILSNPRPQ